MYIVTVLTAPPLILPNLPQFQILLSSLLVLSISRNCLGPWSSLNSEGLKGAACLDTESSLPNRKKNIAGDIKGS